MSIKFDQYTNTLSVVDDSVSNADMTLVSEGNGVVKIQNAYGTQLSVGSSSTTPPTAFANISSDQYGRAVYGSSGATVVTASGTNNIAFQTASTGLQQAVVTHTASAVNYVSVTGASTGGAPSILALGSDTNIPFSIASKGTGILYLSGGQTRIASSGSNSLFVAGPSGAVNYTQISSAGTGFPPAFIARGTDTNIGLLFGTLNDANIDFQASGDPNAGSGRLQLRVAPTASAVNYLQVTGNAAGGAPTISAQGSDANVYLDLKSKGNLQISLYTGGGIQFAALHTASAVNYTTAKGSATGFGVVFGATGSDTNIPVVVQPKGTGAFNIAAGSSGVNISNGGTVTAVTRTAYGSGYTSLPTPSVPAPTTAGGVQAVLSTSYLLAVVATVAAGGTGYTLNDVLTLSGGTFSTATTVTVSAVSGGVVTAVLISNNGNYSVSPSAVAATTGGTGTGCTINISYGINGVNISNAGSGYVEQPTVTFSGGGGSAAAAYATVGSATIIKSVGTTSERAISFRGPSSDSSPTAPDVLRLFDTPALNDTGILIQNSQFGRAQVQTYGNANGSLYLGANGSGRVSFTTNGSSLVEQARVSHTASAVNYVQITGAATGGHPTVSAQGSDAGANLNLQAKGTGAVSFNSHLANYANFYGTNAGTNSVTYQTTGSDTNITTNFQTKGSGLFRFFSGGSTSQEFIIAPTYGGGTSVNSLAVAGSPTGVATILYAQGSDTNISLVVQPKGTGALQAQQTDSTATGGNARGANAVDWQTARSNANQVASGQYSTITGGIGNRSSAYGGFIGGGEFNLSSGYDSVAVAGASNQAQAGYSFVGGGLNVLATGGYSAAVGGYFNTASGFNGFVGGGERNSTTSTASVTTQATTTVTSGSTAVTLSGSNAAIKVGQVIQGTGITVYPNQTYVAAISGTSLTLSQAASGSGSPTLTFWTPHGVVVGGGNNQATGSYSFIGGGGDAGTAANRNVASGDWSFVGGGTRNTASGLGSVIAGGGWYGAGVSYANTASGTSSFIGSGGNNSVGGGLSSVVNGYGNSAAGAFAFVGGGFQNSANSYASSVLGGYYGTTRSIYAYMAFPACFNPLNSVVGASQAGLLILAKQTTDATASVLTCDGSAAATNNQVILPNNSAYYVKGSVIANVTGGGNTKSWDFIATIKRGANAASTAIVGASTINVQAADAGASAWTIAITADTTNGGLAVTVTGQASTTIRWVAKLETTEVTY